jgi:hypothetical protein
VWVQFFYENHGGRGSSFSNTINQLKSVSSVMERNDFGGQIGVSCENGTVGQIKF